MLTLDDDSLSSCRTSRRQIPFISPMSGNRDSIFFSGEWCEEEKECPQEIASPKLSVITNDLDFDYFPEKAALFRNFLSLMQLEALVH